MPRIALFGLLLSVLATGCGSKSTETDDELSYPTEAGFCTALAQAECGSKVVETCYGSDSSTLAEDTKACTDAREKQCNPGDLPYHPEGAKACIDARMAALSDAVWTKAELDSVDEACLPVFSEEGGEGVACTADHACDTAGGLRCILKLGSAEGVCGKAVIVEGGESCADPTTLCKEGFYCDAGSQHCLARPEMGEACSVFAPCAADFYCTAEEAGTCAAKTKNGGECDRDEVCAGGFCIGVGHGTPGVCSSTLPLAISAETCDPYR